MKVLEYKEVTKMDWVENDKADFTELPVQIECDGVIITGMFVQVLAKTYTFLYCDDGVLEGNRFACDPVKGGGYYVKLLEEQVRAMCGSLLRYTQKPITIKILSDKVFKLVDKVV
jgi:hypothetical protein